MKNAAFIATGGMYPSNAGAIARAKYNTLSK